MDDKPRTDIEQTPLKAEIEAVFHYDYFDDMYSPDYVCQDMMKAVIDAIRSGHFPTEEVQRLKEGMEKLKHTEAYEEYGAPFAIGEWEKFQRDERMR